jgi:hypothetical protein
VATPILHKINNPKSIEGRRSAARVRHVYSICFQQDYPSIMTKLQIWYGNQGELGLVFLLSFSLLFFLSVSLLSLFLFIYIIGIIGLY